MPAETLLKQLRLLVRRTDYDSRQAILERGRQRLLRWFAAGAKNMLNGNMSLPKPTQTWVEKHRPDLLQLLDKNVPTAQKYNVILRPGGGGFLGGVIIRAIMRWQQREQTKHKGRQKSSVPRQRQPRKRKSPQKKKKSPRKRTRKRNTSQVRAPSVGTTPSGFKSTFRPVDPGPSNKIIRPMGPVTPLKILKPFQPLVSQFQPLSSPQAGPSQPKLPRYTLRKTRQKTWKLIDQ